MPSHSIDTSQFPQIPVTAIDLLDNIGHGQAQNIPSLTAGAGTSAAAIARRLAQRTNHRHDPQRNQHRWCRLCEHLRLPAKQRHVNLGALCEVNELAQAAQDPAPMPGWVTLDQRPTGAHDRPHRQHQTGVGILPGILPAGGSSGEKVAAAHRWFLCLSPIRLINTHGHPGGASQRLPNLSPSAEF